MIRRGLLSGGAVLLAACQTYDFEPVDPVTLAQARRVETVSATLAKPNIFLLLDHSGSMNDDPANVKNPPAGTRKIDLAVDNLSRFAEEISKDAHLGFHYFPAIPQGASPSAAESCVAPPLATVGTLGVELNTSSDSDLAGMQATVVAIKTRVESLRNSSKGGTPTAVALDTFGAYTPLSEVKRQNYVVLLTDGLPNCNASFSANTPSAGLCSCPNGVVLGNSTNPAMTTCTADEARANCLDDQGAVAAVARLRKNKISTIVIGFGLGTNSAATRTLSDMALAGGFQRPCTQNADCGTGGSCSEMGIDPCGKASRVCKSRFFDVNSGSELSSSLASIRDAVKCLDPCKQVLPSTPSHPEYISVNFDGEQLHASSATWEYVAPVNNSSPLIQFRGAYCDKLNLSTPLNPVHLDIRTLEVL